MAKNFLQCMGEYELKQYANFISRIFFLRLTYFGTPKLQQNFNRSLKVNGISILPSKSSWKNCRVLQLVISPTIFLQWWH